MIDIKPWQGLPFIGDPDMAKYYNKLLVVPPRLWAFRYDRSRGIRRYPMIRHIPKHSFARYGPVPCGTCSHNGTHCGIPFMACHVGSTMVDPYRWNRSFPQFAGLPRMYFAMRIHSA